MDEYIDKDKLLDELKESAEHHAENSREEQLMLRDRNIVRAQTPADVVPVIYGKWIKGRTQEKVDWLGVRCKVANYSCSICGRMIFDIDVDGKGLVDTLEDYPYCHCGAKMIESEFQKDRATLSTDRRSVKTDEGGLKDGSCKERKVSKIQRT